MKVQDMLSRMKAENILDDREIYVYATREENENILLAGALGGAVAGAVGALEGMSLLTVCDNYLYIHKAKLRNDYGECLGEYYIPDMKIKKSKIGILGGSFIFVYEGNKYKYSIPLKGKDFVRFFSNYDIRTKKHTPRLNANSATMVVQNGKQVSRPTYYSRTPIKSEPVIVEEKISVADVHSNLYDGYYKEYISDKVNKYIDILKRCLKAPGSKEEMQWLQEHGNTVAFKDILLLDEFYVRFKDEMASVSRWNRNALDYMIGLVHQMDEEIPGTKEISALIGLFETKRELQIKKTLKHIKIMGWVSLFFSLLTGAPEAVMLLVIALPPTVASILFLLNKRPIWGVICTVFFFSNRSDFAKGTLLSTVIIIAITIYFVYVTYLSFLDRKATKKRD